MLFRVAAGVFSLGMVALLPESMIQSTGHFGAEAIAQSTTTQSTVTQGTARAIPPGAKLGTLAIGVFPQATLNGNAISLGPGFRMYDLLSRIVVPATVSGKSLVVAYRVGPIGELIEAWQLSAAEFSAIQARLSAQQTSGSN